MRSEFFRREGKFIVRTDGPDGRLADFEVRHTFGIYPLQQYLIKLPGGRLQALSIAWDARPAESGGQRWFHLYPDERIDHRDELHWTKRQQNWNYMCADCHSTNLQKNYDATADTYATSWSEISVGCEACHGPGSEHVRLAALGRGSEGLTVALDERRGAAWTIDPATGNARRNPPDRPLASSTSARNAIRGVASIRTPIAPASRSWITIGRRCSKPASIIRTASSATRSTTGVRSCRAGCMRRA